MTSMDAQKMSYKDLQKRCIELKRQGFHKEPCSGTNGTREKLEALFNQRFSQSKKLEDSELRYISDVDSTDNSENENTLDIPVKKYMLYKPLSYYGKEIKNLGSGSYGKVYHYDGGEYHTDVAIKIINSYEGDVDVEEQGVREIATLRLLSHPNIIELIDAPVVEGPSFALALPLAELGSLNHAIDQLNDRSKKIVAYQVACGVAYCHSRGIVHRDLKPQNVLIFGTTLSPIAKLADFGTPLVNSCIDEPHQTERATTVLYCSPEGILDQHYTYSNDVWALGVIIYEIFAGDHFIKAENRAEMLFGYIRILGTPPKNIIVSMAKEEEELRLQDPGPTNESLGVKRGELRRVAKRIARKHVEYPVRQFPIEYSIKIILDGIFKWEPTSRSTAYGVVTNKFFDDVRVIDNEYLPQDCTKTLVDILPYPSKEIFNNTQSDITQDKLTILFNWLFSVNSHFKLREDTYQFTIRLIDAYVTIRPIVITKLQLLGLAALYTAMMIREKYMTVSLALVSLSDGAYSSQELVIMHKDILVAIDYGIYFMTPYDFHVVNRRADDLISREGRSAKIVRLTLTTCFERYTLSPKTIEEIAMKAANAYYDNKDVSRSKWVMSLPFAQFNELNAIDTWVKRSGYDDPTYKEIINKLRTPANEL